MKNVVPARRRESDHALIKKPGFRWSKRCNRSFPHKRHNWINRIPHSCRYFLKTMGWINFIDPEPTGGSCRRYGLPVATQTSNQIIFNEAGKPESPRPTCAPDHHARPPPDNGWAASPDCLPATRGRWNCGIMGRGRRCGDLRARGPNTYRYADTVIPCHATRGKTADCPGSPE